MGGRREREKGEKEKGGRREGERKEKGEREEGGTHEALLTMGGCGYLCWSCSSRLLSCATSFSMLLLVRAVSSRGHTVSAAASA